MDVSLDDFLALSDDDKLPHIQGRGVLFARQFQRADHDHLGRVADAARAMARSAEGRAALADLLPERMALNVFLQPSSRTFLSFNAAQASLGMDRTDMRSAATSSMSKGESLVDTVRTFINYVDLIVLRHPDEQAAATAFWTACTAHRQVTLPSGERVPVPIVSGGSGTREHPTQALLDIYTLQRALRPVGGLDGKTVMLVGDLARGRTARSLATTLPEFHGVSLIFAAPERYRMGDDICAVLDERGVPWRRVNSIDAGLEAADAVYMTRIQDEHDADRGPGHVRADDRFRFELDHLQRLRPHAPLLHPLPKRDEIDPAVDALDDPRVRYWHQERNGVWMRVALITRLFAVDGALLAAAEQLGG